MLTHQIFGRKKMAFTGPVEDRLAIHELVASYADAVSRRDAQDWGDLWATDAMWCVPSFPSLERVEGRETIRAAWSQAMANFSMNLMVQTLGALEVQGSSATGRAYHNELVTDLDGHTRTAMGLYEDEYIRVDGAWQFAKRTFTSLHSGA
jgi:ketosteroid isomerase-like protein